MTGSAEAPRPALGVTAAVAAVLVWGSSSVLIKEVHGLAGVSIAAYRLWIGAALVTAVFLLQGGRLGWSLLRRSFWGGIAFGFDIVLFFTSLQHTSVANATIIGALQPLLLLALAGPMFGERATWSDAAWGSLAIAGAAAVVLGGASGSSGLSDGDVLAVGALLAWTAYFAASKAARAHLSSLEYLTGLSIVAAVVITPAPALLGEPLGHPTAHDWGLIVVIAVVNGALGHFLMNWSHAHVPLVVTSLLTLAVPVVSSTVAVPVLDERLVAAQVAGMAVVVGALAVVAVHGARRRPDARDAEVAAIAVLPEP